MLCFYIPNLWWPYSNFDQMSKLVQYIAIFQDRKLANAVFVRILKFCWLINGSSLIKRRMSVDISIGLTLKNHHLLYANGKFLLYHMKTPYYNAMFAQYYIFCISMSCYFPWLGIKIIVLYAWTGNSLQTARYYHIFFDFIISVEYHFL